MFKRMSYQTLLAVSVLVLTACSNNGPELIVQNAPDVSDDGVYRPLVSIFDTAIAAGTFTTLVSALQATELDADLADESKIYTVFAPTDAAFEKLGADVVNEWFANPEAMQNLLRYHAVSGRTIGSLEAVGMIGRLLEMANGDNVSITHDGEHFYINKSEVIVTDVMATNGIIHVIDTVLIPPVIEPTSLNIVETIVAEGTFKVLNQALAASGGLLETLSNTNDKFTLFAPTDEAFAKLPAGRMDALFSDQKALKNMLLYHMVGGKAVDSITANSLSGQQIRMSNGTDAAIYLIDDKLKINESTITISDLVTSNGIIHAIDSVLTPPTHSIDSPDHEQAAVGSIFDLTRNSPKLSMFSTAIELAGIGWYKNRVEINWTT